MEIEIAGFAELREAIAQAYELVERDGINSERTTARMNAEDRVEQIIGALEARVEPLGKEFRQLAGSFLHQTSPTVAGQSNGRIDALFEMDEHGIPLVTRPKFDLPKTCIWCGEVHE